MNITADTSVLVRAIVADEPRQARKVKVNRPAVETRLALLDQGGDFADGIIAFEGASLGAATFASFDKDAARRLKTLGIDSLLLAEQIARDLPGFLWSRILTFCRLWRQSVSRQRCAAQTFLVVCSWPPPPCRRSETAVSGRQGAWRPSWRPIGLDADHERRACCARALRGHPTSLHAHANA